MAAQPFLDRPALAAILAGGLLIAISFLTNYGYAAFLTFNQLSLDEQIGVCLHAAALAALVGDAELATRLRSRARRSKAESDEIKALCFAAGFRFLLADTPRNRQQLTESVDVLIEQVQLSMSK